MDAKAGERSIAEWRQDIDRIDAELVKLLNQRAQCALAIGAIKRREGQPVHVPEREKEVLARVSSMSKGPMTGQAIQAVYQTIMGQMRALEEALGR